MKNSILGVQHSWCIKKVFLWYKICIYINTTKLFSLFHPRFIYAHRTVPHIKYKKVNNLRQSKMKNRIIKLYRLYKKDIFLCIKWRVICQIYAWCVNGNIQIETLHFDDNTISYWNMQNVSDNNEIHSLI